MIKDNIKKARLKSGLTQAQVANKLGVSQSQYARWESGGRNPKDDTLEKLAEIFGVGTDTIKGRDDGLEEIIELLRKHKMTEVQKVEVYHLLLGYFEE